MINKILQGQINKRLLDILLDPATSEKLIPDSSGEFLITGSGSKYEIESGIPIVLDNQTINSFDYQKHYTLDAEKFDYFEERYGGTKHDERRVKEFVISKIDKSAESILDAGCGKAWVAEAMINKGRFVVSMDISITNPRKAIEKYPSPNHAALVADALSMPFPDSIFDCIVCSEVIEHVTEPDRLIRELLRCVRPGGELILTTPYKEVLRYSLCIHCNRMTPINAHLHSFDEKKLKEYAVQNKAAFEWHSFGNKALMHIRAHVILKFLPFGLWKLKDKFFNLIINRPAHIIAIYKKKS